MGKQIMSKALVELTFKDEDSIAIIRMRDKKGKNSFNKEFLQAFHATLAEANSDNTRVIILCGLPDVFCSGAPLELLQDLESAKLKPTELDLPRTLLSLPVPVISAMKGHATGGGFAIGLCADIVVIARESRYGANFMSMGFTPGMGMTRLLEDVVTSSLAQEMLYTGSYYRGSFFEQRGGFNRVVAKRDVEDVAYDIALQIAEKPRKALELLKQTFSARRLSLYQEAFLKESMMHEICFNQAETKQLIANNFLE